MSHWTSPSNHLLLTNSTEPASSAPRFVLGEGPGTLIAKLYNTGGAWAENHAIELCTKLGRAQGPVPIAQKIEKLFDEKGDHLLNELYVYFNEKPLDTSEDIRYVQNQCAELIKYANRYVQLTSILRIDTLSQYL